MYFYSFALSSACELCDLSSCLSFILLFILFLRVSFFMALSYLFKLSLFIRVKLFLFSYYLFLSPSNLVLY